MQPLDLLAGLAASGASAFVHSIAATQMGHIGGALAAIVPFLLGAYVRAAIRAAVQTKPSSPEHL